MPNASRGHDSRSHPPSGFTASRLASQSTSTDVTLDAIATVLDDRIFLLQFSDKMLTSQYGNLQIEI